MEIQAFRADAVVMATGGNGMVFGKSTMSVICTGGAASRCYQAGAWLGNPEFMQVHPHRHPRRRQMPPDERIGTRRRRACLGSS